MCQIYPIIQGMTEKLDGIEIT